MKQILTKSKKYLKLILLIILICIILSLLNLLGANVKITSIIQYFIIILTIFIFNFKNVKSSEKKGLFIGAKNGLLIISIMFILSLILYRSKYSFYTSIYYIVIFLSSIFGAIIGKNKSTM